MANDRILRTYDPKQIAITFGAIIFTGYADGDFLEITGEDGFEFREGADGSEDRINKNKNGKDINITLMQSSITNDALSAVFLVDTTTNQGIFPLVIKDLNGTTTLFSGQAYIKKLPDKTFGDSLGTITWNFRAVQSNYFVGGNI